jgi:hypothetical protein
MHATDRQQRHACGGTILGGPDHKFCDRCCAFTTRGGAVPDGLERRVNQEAWECGASRSPGDGPDYNHNEEEE